VATADQTDAGFRFPQSAVYGPTISRQVFRIAPGRIRVPRQLRKSRHPRRWRPQSGMLLLDLVDSIAGLGLGGLPLAEARISHRFGLTGAFHFASPSLRGASLTFA